jgi:AcrR family transcriptional regulator
MATQILFQRRSKAPADLRSRKKERLRFAIQDAALELFAAQGYEETSIEEIVARAETSVTTFFRYFRNKSEVLVDDDGTHLKALQQRIAEWPKQESDIAAICEALLEGWVRTVDSPLRVMRMAAVVESSTLLLGLRYEVVQGWIDAVAHALAKRNGKRSVSRRHVMISRMVLGVFCDSVDEWIKGGCRSDLRRLVKRDFDAMMLLREEMKDAIRG